MRPCATAHSVSSPAPLRPEISFRNGQFSEMSEDCNGKLSPQGVKRRQGPEPRPPWREGDEHPLHKEAERPLRRRERRGRPVRIFDDGEAPGDAVAPCRAAALAGRPLAGRCRLDRGCGSTGRDRTRAARRFCRLAFCGLGFEPSREWLRPKYGCRLTAPDFARLYRKRPRWVSRALIAARGTQHDIRLG